MEIGKNAQIYESPEALVVSIGLADVITTSGTEAPKENPWGGEWDSEI